jgi:replicative DNA helicase
MVPTINRRPTGNGTAAKNGTGRADQTHSTGPWGHDDDPIDVAEVAVLGAAMLDRQAATGVLATLTGDDFRGDAHRVVFDAVEGLVAAGSPVDLVTVTDRLACGGRLDEVGGPVALSRLADPLTCPSPAAWHAYAAIVLRASRTRRVRSALARAIHRIDDGTDVEQVASEVAAEVKPW